MSNNGFGAELAREGVAWYLRLCATAIRVQERRLLDELGDINVDAWLTLIALRNGLRAVEHLAPRASPRPEAVLAEIERFEHSKAVKKLRNAFEHFDKYIFGKENAGQISIVVHHGKYRRRVTISFLGNQVEIPTVTDEAVELIGRVSHLL